MHIAHAKDMHVTQQRRVYMYNVNISDMHNIMRICLANSYVTSTTTTMETPVGVA